MPWEYQDEDTDPSLSSASMLPSAATLAILSFFVLALGCSARDEPAAVSLSADAGPDQRVRLGATVTLDGSRSVLSPLIFWTGDGDGPTEDRLVRYDSRIGVTTKLLRDALNNTLGWPGDAVLVDGDIIGVDTWRGQIVLIVLGSGNFRQLTAPLPNRLIMGLAYDTRSRRLLASDATSGELLSINLSTGSSSVLCKLDGIAHVTGVA